MEDNKEGLLCIKLPPVQCECTVAPTEPGDGEAATLRDQFAMAALTGMLSGMDVLLTPDRIPDVVDASYQAADLMLVVREPDAPES